MSSTTSPIAASTTARYVVACRTYIERAVDGSYTFGPDDIGEDMLPPG
jgi:hypothetical protein